MWNSLALTGQILVKVCITGVVKISQNTVGCSLRHEYVAKIQNKLEEDQ